MIPREELLRRMRALYDLPLNERPINIRKLAELAGLNERFIEFWAEGRYQIKINKDTQRKLERAFEMLEQGKLSMQKEGQRKTIAVGPPKPPQITARRIQFTDRGPRVRFVAINPLTFPILDGFTRKADK